MRLITEQTVRVRKFSMTQFLHQSMQCVQTRTLMKIGEKRLRRTIITEGEDKIWEKKIS